MPLLDVRRFYELFNALVTRIDCGKKCAPHNLTGKPFCCDICQAVPAAYKQEWQYLRRSTDLWHEWRGDECPQDPGDPEELRAQMPETMLLLACLGPSHCQRDFRAISCRQFPFFPYITSTYRFIGLAYDWEFEKSCWVLSNLGEVTETYRREFIDAFDTLFSLWPNEMDSYAEQSELARGYFAGHRRRIPVLHRSGQFVLVSPRSERIQRVGAERLKRFGPYAGE